MFASHLCPFDAAALSSGSRQLQCRGTSEKTQSAAFAPFPAASTTIWRRLCGSSNRNSPPDAALLRCSSCINSSRRTATWKQS
jgi:hypothetical protein